MHIKCKKLLASLWGLKLAEGDRINFITATTVTDMTVVVVSMLIELDL